MHFYQCPTHHSSLFLSQPAGINLPENKFLSWTETKPYKGHRLLVDTADGNGWPYNTRRKERKLEGPLYHHLPHWLAEHSAQVIIFWWCTLYSVEQKIILLFLDWTVHGSHVPSRGGFWSIKKSDLASWKDGNVISQISVPTSLNVILFVVRISQLAGVVHALSALWQSHKQNSEQSKNMKTKLTNS